MTFNFPRNLTFLLLIPTLLGGSTLAFAADTGLQAPTISTQNLTIWASKIDGDLDGKTSTSLGQLGGLAVEGDYSGHELTMRFSPEGTDWYFELTRLSRDGDILGSVLGAQVSGNLSLEGMSYAIGHQALISIDSPAVGSLNWSAQLMAVNTDVEFVISPIPLILPNGFSSTSDLESVRIQNDLTLDVGHGLRLGLSGSVRVDESTREPQSTIFLAQGFGDRWFASIASRRSVSSVSGVYSATSQEHLLTVGYQL